MSSVRPFIVREVFGLMLAALVAAYLVRHGLTVPHTPDQLWELNPPLIIALMGWVLDSGERRRALMRRDRLFHGQQSEGVRREADEAIRALQARRS
ncbi:hypothetical protein [Rhodovibrio salinarum]|uniref:Uncharacterized protein n=1 Tax=Rhodovibrio salinarum TaxID=1087 RepID=A0A934V136_9PROT|nr:hypothetical protein [Rhodovibrio salinarum]MBK1698306.1 hypothetical protein [Rhodovibrio salinarum]